MTQVTLTTGETITLDWNLYAMTMMEFFVAEAPTVKKSNLANATMMILAAIHGGTPDCTLNLETLQRKIGKSMEDFRLLSDAASKEYQEFEQLNRGMAPSDDKKKADSSN